MTTDVSADFRAAASLFFGAAWRAPWEPTGDSLVRYVTRNKLPLAAAAASDVLDELVDANPAFREAVADHRVRHDVATQEYGAISAAWASAGIRAALIKSPGYTPYTSDNMDVLVRPSQARPAQEVLQRLGYVELPWIAEPFKQLFRKIEGTPYGFAIHLHTRVAWINSFVDGDDLMDGAVEFRPGFLRPSDLHVALITLAHAFYEDKELKLRDLWHLSQAAGGDVAWDLAESSAARKGWREGFRAAVAISRSCAEAAGRGDLGLPATGSGAIPAWARRRVDAARGFPVVLPRLPIKAMHLQKSVRDEELRPKEKLTELSSVAWFAVRAQWDALRRQPPYLIAVRGSDRDDTEAYARRLRDELAGMFGLDVRVATSRIDAKVRRPAGWVQIHPVSSAGGHPGDAIDVSISLGGAPNGVANAWEDDAELVERLREDARGGALVIGEDLPVAAVAGAIAHAYLRKNAP